MKDRRSERREARWDRSPGWVIGLAVMTLACGVSPIDHRIKLGEEPFVVFVGEGNDQNTDLFTTTTAGGEVYQLTFTRVIERAPALDHRGGMVAFLRMRDTLPGTRRDLVIMSLETGAEKTFSLPAAAGVPRAIGWSADDRTVYLRADGGLWGAAIATSGEAVASVSEADTLMASQATAVWLGQPPFAQAIPCPTGLCVIGPRHDTAALSASGHDPMRWGRDSVAWFEGDEIVVRPLGAGRARRVVLKGAPANAREGRMSGGGR